MVTTNLNNSQQLLFGSELSGVMTGSAVLIGTLPVAPAKIIFDNQGTASVAIYTNGTTNLWRTFPAGEALVVDLNDTNAKGPLRIGTTFYGVGASGTFSISYMYFQSA